jgi:hypothetical protein
MYIYRTLILLSLLGFFSSCSGTKWIVQSEPVIDYKSPSLKLEYVYPLLINTPTPRQPVLEFEIISVNESEYPKRLQSRRHVQQYGLRPGLIAVTLIGSAALLYVANSPNTMIDTGLNNQKLILNVSAGVMAASGFIAVKPVGKPLPTEETKLMNQVGTILLRDSTSYKNETILNAFVSVSYMDSILVNRVRREFVNGKMLLDMSREVPLFPVSLIDPGEFVIQIEVAGNVGTTKIPVSSVMSQFVRVRSSSTPLRSSPREVPSNILSNIVTGSQLLYQETHDAEWIRVLYGAASTYLKRTDVDFIWRPIEKNNESLVITSREADFGSVDIERDIPIFRGLLDLNKKALIIGNSDYLSGIAQKSNSLFNADIINRYLTTTAGISSENRINLQNPDRVDLEEIFSFQGRQTGLKNVLTDSSSLVIYITGKGYLDQQSGSLFYLPSDTRPDLPTITGIEFESIFNSVARLPFKQCIIYVDVDFSTNFDSEHFVNQLTDNEPYEKVIRNFLTRPNTAIIFSNQLSQSTGEYKSADGRLNNRYSIATYFFTKAIKEQRASVGDIFQFMENNINFTSRLLHNRAQSPVFFGDSSLRLVR